MRAGSRAASVSRLILLALAIGLVANALVVLGVSAYRQRAFSPTLATALERVGRLGVIARYTVVELATWTRSGLLWPSSGSRR